MVLTGKTAFVSGLAMRYMADDESTTDAVERINEIRSSRILEPP